MELPPLYCSSKTGKEKVWEVKCLGDTITVITGYIDGKKTEHTTKVIQKNIGRSNETSLEQQAILEAQSKWKKKKDMGFHEKGQTNDVILPMLALDFNKRGKDIKFPCYVQPKVDGVRAVLFKGKIFSRQGKEFKNLGHLVDGSFEFPLDGELYSELLTFQEIVGIVKKEKLSKADATKIKLIKYIVYDIINDDVYMKRRSIISGISHPYFVILKTETCRSVDDVQGFHDKYVSEGYEGLMLRNVDGKYLLKDRSKDLQKFKKFQDAEFEISGFTQGIGVEEGLIIYECKTSDGQTFTVRPCGTHTQRSKMFKKGNDYIGKQLTVKFFEYTDGGIPRFPTTMRGGVADIRDPSL